MMNIYKLAVISLLCTFISCHSTSKTKDVSNYSSSIKTYEKIALVKYGEDIVYQMNESKTHTLCIGSSTESNFTVLSFFIYDIINEELVYESTQRIRKVEWISNKEVQVDLMIGISTDNDSENYYIYNIEKKKKQISKP